MFSRSCLPLCVFLLTILYLPARAQVSINSDPFIHTENFNALPSSATTIWTNDQTLPEWYAVSSLLAPLPYRVNSGTNGSAGMHSHGTVPSERALGSVNQDISEEIVYGVLFQNNSIVTFHSATVSLHVEQWRRVKDAAPGYQRVKVSYAVGPAIDLSDAALLNNDLFIDLPEATLITIDTVTELVSSVARDGNTLAATISIEFPFELAPGAQFFLRFLDENASGGPDVPISIDDLNVTFLSQTVAYVSANTTYPVHAYLDMGIVEDIPKTESYLVPSPLDLANWDAIFSDFFLSQWASLSMSASLASYGYVLAEYTSSEGSVHILRKQNTSDFYWGTYVVADDPLNSVLVVQAPHPVNDQYTGRQGSFVFGTTHARALMVAGTGRCATLEESPCEGLTSACAPNAPFRLSDVAHATNSIFHRATISLATLEPSTVFVQLHGFSQEPGVPTDFFVSCGSLDAHKKSVPDYAVLVREALLASDPEWDVTITHVDNDQTLGARDNVQGRYLNQYGFGDICTSGINPTTVTNRFLHIEQYPRARKLVEQYSAIATAINSAINESLYVRQIPITPGNLAFTQDFNSLSSQSGPHTWGNNMRLSGWYAAWEQPGLFSIYTTDGGSVLTGGLRAYGVDGQVDRALGSLNPNAFNDIVFGVLFRNLTASAFHSVRLSYHIEQWIGVSGSPQRVKLSYKIANQINLTPDSLLNDALFTPVSTGDMISIDNATNGTVNGTLTFSDITNLNIPVTLNSGHELFIRFLDEDAPGNDAALALDDFSITFSEDALPIEWVYFEVSETGKLPLLRWGADEKDECNSYIIQRSQTGKDFKTIAEVPCRGMPIDSHYEYIDAGYNRFSGRMYYRIGNLDEDGKTSFSSVRVFNWRSVPNAEIYFSSGSFTVQVPSGAALESCRVLDFLGRDLQPSIPIRETPTIYTVRCPAASDQFVILELKLEGGARILRQLKLGR